MQAVTDQLSVSQGSPHTLGAAVCRGGVNFAVFSRHAVAIDLCLYDSADAARESRRVRLRRGEADIWHIFVQGLGPGAVYGYRAHGPWLPANGMRFNEQKLLLDPYAKAIVGVPAGRDDMLTAPGPHTLPGLVDNGATALKSVVVSDEFDWEGDSPPGVEWRDTVLYELHVKGFTRLHPEVPEPLRGTYAGLCHPSVIDYLKALGVTSVQLLPVHQHLDDGFLLDKGLTNYWGYNTIGFFAPHNEFAAARDPLAQVREFKEMVRAFHRTGIEVILDVVYNHTAEGDERGPSLMFRGLDNTAYYRHGFDGNTMFYSNVTGCGNSVASHTASALRLILDSLRYWVTEMHVDGFRFDLAVTVGRDREFFHAFSPFFTALAQDPVLSRVKLIAEPWDVGERDSYQIGKFPEPWRELNGKYRDTVRRYWRGDEGTTAEFAKRLCGSEDLYGWNRRPPLVSVNLVTSHDGFTLRDLFTFSEKHNLANGEGNRDGDNENHSSNCGVEGETSNVKVKRMRARLQRSMIASMMCSLGVPFITAGDERGRTQRGNNNAYCQDNEISWIDWASGDDALLDFARRMIAFRNSRPALRRHEYFNGKHNPDTDRLDVTWLDGQGGPLTHEEWHDPARRCFGALFDQPEDRGRPVNGHGEDHRPFLLLFNQGEEEIDFFLPGEDRHNWELVFDTGIEPSFVGESLVHAGGGEYSLLPRSVACLVLLS
jgi:isoamylase